MSTVYFCGYRLEHFAGLAGIGSPVYTTATASDTNEANSLGYVTIYATSPNADWGYGCLWGNFISPSGVSIPTNNFWVTFETNIACTTAYTETQLQQFSPVVIRGQSGTAFLHIRPTPNATNSFRLLLSPSLTDPTGFIDLGIPCSITAGINKFSIQVSGAGTTNGVITWYSNGSLIGTWTGDMTNYANFNAISFHNSSPSTGQYFYYCYVTDYETRHSYLNYATANAQGSDVDWTGNLTPFSTYPVNYGVLGGMYATGVGQKATYKFNKTFTDQSGYIPSAVVISSAVVTDSASTIASVAGVVKDPVAGTDAETLSQTPNANGNGITWYLTQDPLLTADWALANVNGYEFGLERTE